MIQTVLSAYGLEGANVQPFGTGLINNTWKIAAAGKTYILQRINHHVFKEPQNITDNIRLMAEYLSENHPDYLFVAPVASKKGDDMMFLEGEGFFRLFPFVSGSHTIDVVQTPGQAYEAAAQFGRFTRLLSGIDIKKLKITIPDFHNLSLRYRQFRDALKNGNKKRINESREMVETVSDYAGIVNVYEKIKTDPAFHLRVTHHDTKISNVLFDKNDKGLCVIDLDTVMPGYFISDAGDMMRTYLSPVSEEEIDLNKITVREDFYKAIVQGYIDEMKDELTEREKDYFFYAGQFMIYMQALRFLTDYFNNDVYYGEKYPGHNLVRAKNQITLLRRLLQQEVLFKKLM
ncbi:MAG TPA: aminoglycoside phosphotransferase family protein [Chitinophagaceae bacterium]|nr:aminoglycoside phosphotransferase family protein [Chitinophagaceae bacterium]